MFDLAVSNISNCDDSYKRRGKGRHTGAIAALSPSMLIHKELRQLSGLAAFGPRGQSDRKRTSRFLRGYASSCLKSSTGMSCAHSDRYVFPKNAANAVADGSCDGMPTPEAQRLS